VASDDDIGALYREPPEAFVEARDALVKRLRDEGRGPEAARVKGLRKPTVPAWAVDQLASRDPDGVEELLEAGAELRRAQRQALSGKNPDDLREATEARRSAVARLTSAAAAALRAAGRSEGPHVDEIAATLEAASIDPDAGERLRAGTLDRPLSAAAGFEDIVGLRSVPSPEAHTDEAAREARSGKEAPPADPRTAKEAATRELQERVRELEADLADARRDRDAVERRARKAGSDADRAREKVATAESRLESTRTDLREAEGRKHGEDMALRRSQKELDRATERLERARRELSSRSR
jgi:hypothetical protein